MHENLQEQKKSQENIWEPKHFFIKVAIRKTLAQVNFAEVFRTIFLLNTFT